MKEPAKKNRANQHEAASKWKYHGCDVQGNRAYHQNCTDNGKNAGIGHAGISGLAEHVPAVGDPVRNIGKRNFTIIQCVFHKLTVFLVSPPEHEYANNDHGQRKPLPHAEIEDEQSKVAIGLAGVFD